MFFNFRIFNVVFISNIILKCFIVYNAQTRGERKFLNFFIYIKGFIYLFALFGFKYFNGDLITGSWQNNVISFNLTENYLRPSLRRVNEAKGCKQTVLHLPGNYIMYITQKLGNFALTRIQRRALPLRSFRSFNYIWIDLTPALYC